MKILRREAGFTRGVAAAVATLSLAGCGFHPLYGTVGAGSSLGRKLATIYVEPVSDYGVANTGYELRNALINDLDSGEGARYRLKVTMKVTTQGLALLTSASVTRYNDTITVNYTLTDSETGQVVTKGIETGNSAYNVVTSPYSTLVAQQDADKRAALDIAERLRIDLGVFFEQQKHFAE
jgi:LPS-assembly lipoprotein